MDTISYDDFLNVDIRVGTIMNAKEFPEARRPAYKLEIDFGYDIGIKKSSAQITQHYKLEDLEGKQIIAVVNFPAKQIGPFMSEVLVLGLHDANNDVTLLTPDAPVPNGHKMC